MPQQDRPVVLESRKSRCRPNGTTFMSNVDRTDPYQGGWPRRQQLRRQQLLCRAETRANWIVCRSAGGAVPWAIAPAGPDETAPGAAVNDARALLGMTIAAGMGSQSG
jgi:hypothetical protein